MKLIMDYNRVLTRVENKNTQDKFLEDEIKSLDKDIIIKNDLTPFEKFYLGNDINKELKIDKHLSIFENYLQIRDLILSLPELIKKFNFDFFQRLKKVHLERLYFQKITYEIEEDEDINKIYEAFRELKTGSLFRAYLKKDRYITSYSSTFGLWFIDNTIIVKTAESSGSERIRSAYTLRQLKYPSKLQNIAKLNYPLFEDVDFLFKKELISKFHKTIEQSDGSLKDDDISLYALKYHFLKELNEEQLREISKRQEALFKLNKSKSHLQKPHPTSKNIKEMSEKNEFEIHSTYESSLDIKYSQEIDKIKSANIKEYLAKVENELIERQRVEIEELKLKVFEAKEHKEKAKNEFLKALQSGATLHEAKLMLESSKYNSLTIDIVLEELKADLVSVMLKDKIIEDKQKKIDILIEKNAHLEKIDKELRDENEELNRKLSDVNGDLEIVIETISKLKDKINFQSAQILDLNEEIKEKNLEIENLTKELDKFYQNQNQKEKSFKVKKRIKHGKKIKSKK